jgi:hypothetical protein
MRSNDLKGVNLSEQQAWVKDQLTELWGDVNMADYYVNPDRVAASKSSAKKRTEALSKSASSALDSQMGQHQVTPGNIRRGNGGGLFAYMIWDNLREDSGEKIKAFDLNAELKVNFF